MSDKSPQSFRDIIGLWPNLAEFAADLKVKIGTATLMKFRDSIGPDNWPKLIDAAKKRRFKGINTELLFRLRQEKKSNRAA